MILCVALSASTCHVRKILYGFHVQDIQVLDFLSFDLSQGVGVVVELVLRIARGLSEPVKENARLQL